MKAKLTILFILSLFSLSFAVFARGAQDTINLRIYVSQNIHSYFDEGILVVKTNNSMPVALMEDEILGEIRYTITPEL